MLTPEREAKIRKGHYADCCDASVLLAELDAVRAELVTAQSELLADEDRERYEGLLANGEANYKALVAELDAARALNVEFKQEIAKLLFGEDDKLVAVRADLVKAKRALDLIASCNCTNTIAPCKPPFRCVVCIAHEALEKMEHKP